MKKIFLDARQMDHPEPLERAIAILRKMDSNSYLYMLHRKNPVPLLSLSKEHNFNVVSEKRDGQWHILICIDMNINLGSFIETIESEGV